MAEQGGEKRQGEIREIKKGSFLIVDDHPCKIVSVDISAPGKHGHAKARIEGFSLFDGSRHSTISPTHSKCDIPIIDKRQAQVLSLAGNRVQLMDAASYETFDMDLPEDEDVKKKATPGNAIDYWVVMGRHLLKT
jgi:translation initiation factor 5A